MVCRLFPLIALLVSLTALASDAEVVSSLTTCKSSFYKGQIPKNIATNNHVRICQLLNNKYHYATLFDKEKRVPVYSAYVFKSGNTSERPPWYYEPQVSDPNSSEKSMLEYKPGSGVKNQATDEDYKDLSAIKYTKGHVNPFSHNSGDGATATCTYTNVVPQLANFNNDVWSAHEKKLANKLKDTCGNPNTPYVIVGAYPSNDKFIGVNKKVNVPEFMWSAFCCADKNNKGILSGAYWAKHDSNSKVYKINMSELEKKITKDPNNPVTIFAGGCEAQGFLSEMTDGWVAEGISGNALVEYVTSLLKSLWTTWFE
ncbi:endonuclease domain-containing 1 protein-like [Polyodon spathula]|uniref:endonuclease domain-containing 1 protein-like n=1 Tax=Polyodon spathula TaxID=7913 RepID=UPI001B7E377E|nr:endonuclease domain-containing 1 protein-like [Polyodon spathula]